MSARGRNVIEFYEHFQHLPVDRSITTSATVIVLPMIRFGYEFPVEQPFKLPRVRRRARSRIVEDSHGAR